MMTNRYRSIALFVLSAYIAFIFVQSLFFKFTGSVESIFIFSTLRDWSGIGLFEPFGRFFIGASELVASILLFIPRTRFFGAGMALGIISGAIVFHLFTPLGVEIMGDGGLLYLAVIAAAGALLVVTGAVMTRKHAPRTCPARRNHYAAGPR